MQEYIKDKQLMSLIICLNNQMGIMWGIGGMRMWLSCIERSGEWVYVEDGVETHIMLFIYLLITYYY